MDHLEAELSSWPDLLVVVVTGSLIYAGIIAGARINGLRSFSKLSAFDFATTVAVGTTFASTMLSKSITLSQGLVGVATLFALQTLVTKLRNSGRLAHRVFDNSPLLLMDGERILHDNLRTARVTEDDLRTELRQNNVLRLSEVRAVVMETTGDVSVLHADDTASSIEPWLLEHVRR